MTFQCTLNTRLKKIAVVAAKSKQYSPFSKINQKWLKWNMGYIKGNFKFCVSLIVSFGWSWETMKYQCLNVSRGWLEWIRNIRIFMSLINCASSCVNICGRWLRLLNLKLVKEKEEDFRFFEIESRSCLLMKC